ncbi:MAG: hypothetical protein ACE5D4_06350, partial [Thermodesulfobacteriota bacterium]
YHMYAFPSEKPLLLVYRNIYLASPRLFTKAPEKALCNNLTIKQPAGRDSSSLITNSHLRYINSMIKVKEVSHFSAMVRDLSAPTSQPLSALYFP